MAATLKLLVETETSCREGVSQEPRMLVHVIPCIDGDRYVSDYKSFPFMALAVWGQGLKTGEVWPFNCECGVPACARFNDPMQITVDATSVRWSFPRAPYDEVAVSRHGVPKPREFVFDRGQYAAAFELLLGELTQLEAIHGHLNIHPESFRSLSVQATLDGERNHAEYRAVRRAALGDLDAGNVDFIVTTQAGLELSAPVASLVLATAAAFMSTDGYDLPRTREALEGLAKDLRTAPNVVLRRLDVYQLSAHLRAGEFDLAEDSESRSPAPSWIGPDSSAEDIGTWREIQKTATASVRRRER